jgi:peroxiredoxin
MIDKLILPFDLLSDPEGSVIRQYDVWDEGGRIARPAMFVVDRVGVIRDHYVGRDFADRPDDHFLFQALERAAS